MTGKINDKALADQANDKNGAGLKSRADIGYCDCFQDGKWLTDDIEKMPEHGQAEIYLKLLARLSHDFKNSQGGESRATMRRIESLMRRAEINFRPSLERVLTDDERSELHPYQQDAGKLSLADALLKSEISYRDTRRLLQRLSCELADNKSSMEELHSIERMAPFWRAPFVHWSNRQRLNALENAQGDINIRFFETVSQLEEVLATINSCFVRAFGEDKIILKNRPLSTFRNSEQYLDWANKYHSWLDEMFYHRRDVFVALTIRRQLLDRAN